MIKKKKGERSRDNNPVNKPIFIEILYFQHYTRHCKVSKDNVLMPDRIPDLKNFTMHLKHLQINFRF